MAVATDLVLEDGTGFDNSNTFALTATGDTYHDLRGNGAWVDASGTEKATSLINGTQYLCLRWAFFGAIVTPATPTVTGQALCWPRDNGFSGSLFDVAGNEIEDDEIPQQIIDATLEYALVHLETGRLLKDPTVPDDAGRFVTLKREKLGPLEEETRYSDSRGTRTVARYAQADRIIRESGLALASIGDQAIRA